MPYIGNPIYQSAFVTDQFSGDGTTTAFTMSVAPAGVTNVLVAVSGVLQDPSTYGVVGNTITFSAAPPSGTGNISCRYLGVPASGITTTAYRTVTEFTATASQTTFTPPSYNVGFINVYLNGVLLGSADYTATNGTTVVLAVGASAGNLVTVESFLISSVANAIPNAAGSVGTTNIADNSITTAKIAAGAVIPADLSTGGPFWDTSGRVGIGNVIPGSFNNFANSLVIGTGAADSGLTVYTGSSNAGSINFADGTSPTQAYQGFIQYNHPNDGMDFFVNYAGSGGTSPRMRIDFAGRVTMPYQPAFMARTYLGDGNSIGSLRAIRFADIDINRGNHFNNTTGLFTCPVAGTYLAYININLRANPSSWTSAFIVRNSTTLMVSWGRDNPALDYVSVVSMGVITCSANDTIALVYDSNYSAPSTGALYNQASIYLLG